MYVLRILLSPLRIFSFGDAFSKDKSASLGKETPPVKKEKEKKSKKLGWRFGNFLLTAVCLLLTVMLFVFLLLMIENTPSFIERFGFLDMGKRLNYSQPHLGPYGDIYRNVLAKAVCASDISLAQVAILFFVVYGGLLLVLGLAADFASSNQDMENTAKGIKGYMFFATITLPALGLLSTAVGVMLSGDIPKLELRYLIFGPTALGILGFILASAFLALAQAVLEKRS